MIPGYTSDINKFNWEEIFKNYPWVQDMRGVPQDSIHHMEGHVETHTRMVVESLISDSEFNSDSFTEEERQLLFVSALLHDVEKRSTTFEEDGRIVSPGHAKKGEKTARLILYRDIPIPFLQREKIAKLVRYHGLPLWVLEKPNPNKAIIESSLYVKNSLIHELAEADINGRICQDANELFDRLDLFRELAMDNKCWMQSKEFPSTLARHEYFAKDECYPDYDPFDDKKCEVYVMCGFPGTGKDYFIEHNLPDLPVLSLDALRLKMKIKPDDTSGTGQVIQQAKETAKEYLRKHQSFIWNGTNLTRQVRQQPIDLCASYGAKVKLIYLEVPYKRLKHQNLNREYPVKEEILERFINKLEMPHIFEAHDVEYIVEGEKQNIL